MEEETKEQSSRDRRLIRKKLGVGLTVTMLGIGIGSVLFAYAAFASANSGAAHNQSVSIRQTIFVFRHGDRTPTGTYPNDPHRNYQWQGGWGALTKRGMLEMYNVGRWIRDKYGSIIGPKYESSLSLVQSSYADRCIMSAQSLLAGLYPPTPEEIFVPDLNWRPVPVHATPRDLDKIVVMKAPCPRLERALEEAYANESARRETVSAEYYQELSAHAGQTIATITDIEFLYNTLEIEERNDLKLPEWTSKYYNQQMREIAARSLAIFTSNTLQRRLRGGPLLKEILSHMRALKSKKRGRQAYLYSAHDITLVNLLRTMGFTSEYFKPEYGATLVFELHDTPSFSDDDAEVKLMYLNGTDTVTPHPMEIANCSTPCLLGTLASLWKDVLPDNWDEECLL